MKQQKHHIIVSLLGLMVVVAAPAAAKECLECHPEVHQRLGSGSHHVQGVALTSTHCAACHWEATAAGGIDQRYHGGKSAGQVDLVLWGRGKRPASYKPASTGVSFQPSAIGTPRERGEVAKISQHCLSCHSDQNNDLRPFAGDPRTPRQYAWDRQSIASRYAQKGTTTWGKYSTAGSNKKKRVTKSFSAHGNAVANRGGWDAAVGYDGDMPVTRGGSGAKNVECFDCHNAHGSQVAGITSSYATHDGSNGGGLLKETIAGKGGYRVSYTPSVNAAGQSSNPFNAGAGLCFDCHETATSGATPWGYNSTFGAKQPIMGYKDTVRFAPGAKGSTGRYAKRQTRTEIASSHLKAGSFLTYSTHGRINGLCTPCHDPHGVSQTLGAKMAYGVPLLKGTWLTSPYREDGPPTTAPGQTAFAKRDGGGNRDGAWEKGDFSATNREANANFGIAGGGSAREPMSMPGMKYNVDRNTFGANKQITETDDTFAGLCLKCHAKEKFAGTSKVDMVHRATKGWGNNKEHAFPCAKCHQAHNSGLPRLMQTNCFEIGPSGLRENSGLPWSPIKNEPDKTSSPDNKAAAKNDLAAKGKSTAKTDLVGCHVRQFGRGNTAGGGAKQGGNQWNERTTW